MVNDDKFVIAVTSWIILFTLTGKSVDTFILRVNI